VFLSCEIKMLEFCSSACCYLIVVSQSRTSGVL
jgi:hypothetical protein